MEKKQLKKMSLQGAAILLSLVIALIVFSVIHSSQVHSAMSSIAQEYFQEKADNSASRAVSVLNSAKVVADMASGRLAVSKEMNPEFQAALAATGGAYDVIFFVDGQGTGMNGSAYEIKNLPFYSRLSESEAKFFYVDDDGLGNGNAILYVKPITQEDTFVGYLVLFLDPASLESYLSPFGYEDYSFLVMMDVESASVMVTPKWAENNVYLKGGIWANLQGGARSTTKWVIFGQRFRTAASGSVETMLEGRESFVYTCPVGDTGFALILGLETRCIDQKMDEVLRSESTFRVEMYILIAAMLGVFLWYVITYRIHTKEKSKELEGKADTDLLTGLNNKVATENRIREYLEENPEGQGVMILIDVDNFKKINDTMGHAFGDEVLRNLGIRLRTLYRVSDICGRLGGDEFVVFLKDIKDDAIILRESRKLETFFHGFEVGEYVKYSVTASLGAAVFSKDGRTFEELYKNADAALYSAKHRGKNQLAFYKDDQKTEEIPAGTDSDEEEGTAHGLK